VHVGLADDPAARIEQQPHDRGMPCRRRRLSETGAPHARGETGDVDRVLDADTEALAPQCHALDENSGFLQGRL